MTRFGGATRITGIIIGILIFLAATEGMAYLTGRYLAKTGKTYAPHITESYETYMNRLDPQLGWPSPRAKNTRDFDLDPVGARVSPAYPDPQTAPACVAVYGDSFAWGDGVDNAHAWANVLAQKLHCRVANFGMVGYGTDQAYRRFQLNQEDQAPVVIFGFSSDNIRRNVNQLRNFIVPSPQCVLKPRFILDERGDLQLVDLPALNAAQYAQLPEHPERFLKHDYFIPDGPSGTPRLAFPYTLSLVRLIAPLYRRAFSGAPGYGEFYAPEHVSQALPVTVAIIRAFVQEARRRGQVPVVVIIPIAYDLENYRQRHEWVYDPLLESLRWLNIPFCNLGPGLVHFLGGRNPWELYNRTDGHFNDEGYQVMASLIYDYLQERQLLPQPFSH